jgi:hypothetical protein
MLFVVPDTTKRQAVYANILLITIEYMFIYGTARIGKLVQLNELKMLNG